MSETSPPYPEAFRAEAVALLRSSGRSILVVAAELGVSEQALRDWVKRDDIEAGQGPPGALTRAELVRLRRLDLVLQQEHEKAAAFFAKVAS